MADIAGTEFYIRPPADKDKRSLRDTRKAIEGEIARIQERDLANSFTSKIEAVMGKISTMNSSSGLAALQSQLRDIEAEVLEVTKPNLLK